MLICTRCQAQKWADDPPRTRATLREHRLLVFLMCAFSWGVSGGFIADAIDAEAQSWAIGWGLLGGLVWAFVGTDR
jgi:hypothetical protein